MNSNYFLLVILFFKSIAPSMGAEDCLPHLLELSKKGAFKQLEISLQNCLEKEKYDLKDKETIIKIAENCYENKKYFLARLCYDKVLIPNEKIKSKALQHEIDSLYLFEKLAYCYFSENKYSSALKYFKLSFKTSHKNRNENTEDFIRLYSVIGRCYSETGDLKTAVEYYYKVSAITISLYGKKHIRTAIAYEQVADLLLLLPKLKEAESLLKESIAIKQSLGDIGEKKIGDSYLSLADLAFRKGRYKNSIAYNNLAYQSFLREGETLSSYKIGLVFNRLGDCNLYIDKYQVAANYYLKFIKILKNEEKRNSTKIAYINSLVGACFSNMGKRRKADYYFGEFFKYSGFDPKKKDAYDKIERNFKIPISLFFKAQNHLFAYKESGEMEELKKAHYWYGICLKIVERINNKVEGQSKQFLLSNFYYLFESILETCYLQYEKTGEERFIEEALDYAEKSRSVLLRDAIKEASAEILLAIPDSIITKEDDFKKALAEIEEEIFDAKKQGDESDRIVLLNGKIFNIQQKKEAFHDLVKREFPAFYKWRYRQEHVSITDARKVLRKDETLVLYFWGDESLFTIIITADTADLKKQKIGPVKENIHHFRNAMIGYHSNPSDSLLNEYVSSASTLYDLILKPISNYLDKKVLIAPDGQLEYIAFDALLSEHKNYGRDWSAYPYLIHQYQFRYTHSVQLLLDYLGTEKSNNGEILAIAPAFSTPKTTIAKKWSLGPLFKNEKEAHRIADYFETNVLAGDMAEKKTFVKEAAPYAALHFATHAIANDHNGGYSFIYFSPVTADTTGEEEVLYAKDICLMNFNADMVVLSACETATGENQRGEGIISLGRSFSFAGIPSLITTLWKVDDMTAADIMSDFYHYLSEKDEKDIALRKAKINIINKGDRHPFFWAAFVPHGDMSAVNFKERKFRGAKWLVVGGIALSLFFGYHFVQRKNRAA